MGQNTIIERWTSDHPRWPELMSLKDIEDLHLEEMAQEWHLGIYTLVALDGPQIAGLLRLWTQEIGVDEDRPPFVVDGSPAVEAKIVTFHVLDNFRNHGIGRALQLAAVEWARELGCYQVRSRSEYSRGANHHLKASLGFGISPGRDRPDGPKGSAFFVLPLRLAPELIPPEHSSLKRKTLATAVVAVVMRGEETLVIRRGPGAPASGMWAPLSGRLEPDETEPEAVIREVLEEVGLEVKPIRRVWECPTEDGKYTLYWWLAEYSKGDLVIDPLEVSEAKWIRPEEFGALEDTFADDRKFYADVFPALQKED